MSYIYHYPNNTVEFSTAGYGALSECYSATSSEELNGDFEIEFEYPTDGSHKIKMGDIALAKPRPGTGFHPFVIDKIERPLEGILKIHASHWSCLLSGIVVGTIVSQWPSSVITRMSTGTNNNGSVITKQWSEFNRRRDDDGAIPYPLNFITLDTNITGPALFKNETPTSFRALMGDEIEGGSLLNVYGGEYVYDPIVEGTPGSKIHLRVARGVEKPIVIQYGVNMTGFNLDEDYTDVYTSLLPYYKSDDNIIIGNVVTSPKTYPFTKFMMADVSSEFTNLEEDRVPTEEEITNAGIKYFNENKIDEPDITLEVETDVYSDLNLDIGDYITVRYPMYNYDAKLECTKIEADILNDVITKMDFTTVKNNASTIIAQSSIATGGNVSKSKKGSSPQGSGSSGGGSGSGSSIYPSNFSPRMDGVSTSGESTLYSRGDHRHPSNTAKLNTASIITNQEIENIIDS